MSNGTVLPEIVVTPSPTLTPQQAQAQAGADVASPTPPDPDNPYQFVYPTRPANTSKAYDQATIIVQALDYEAARERVEREMPRKRQPPGRDTTPVPEVDWSAVIAASLRAERAFTSALLTELVIRLHDDIDARIAAALETYTQKTATTRLTESVDQLRAELKQRALDALGAVVDLPNPLPSKQIN